MKYKILFILSLFAYWGLSPSLVAQETECNPLSGLPVASGELLFNYGSVANAFNSTAKSDYTLGQPLVAQMLAQDHIADFGVWSQFLMPPLAPVAFATQGDFPDRVVVSWKVDPLGAKPTNGFIITRDDAYLTSIEPGIEQFIDFNVQAGEFYEYKVIGKNNFGEGVPGISVGFVNPNGVVTGQVKTNNGNPVVGATVTLTPTTGQSLQFNGNGDYVCVSHNDALPTDMFTVSVWVKIGDTYNSDGIIDLGSDLNENFWLHTTPSSAGKGIVFGVGNGTASSITHEFVDSDPNDTVNDADEWNHVAAVYGGGSLILYVNGQFISSINAPITNKEALFTLGCRRDQSGFLDGWLDEVRIYDDLLTQTDIINFINSTVSSNSEALVGYWKFDEGLGSKVFDLTKNDMDGTLNGARFSDETPEVYNAAMTDESGFYAIEGINYSQEQNFYATPTKYFYDNYALELNAVYQSCATLTNFDLPDTSHVEITVHPFDLQSKQSILSKTEGGSDAFNLFLENSKYYLTINGQTQELGDAAAEYQRLAFSINGNTNTITYYLNGSLVNDFIYTNVTGTWDDEAWQLGAKSISSPADFFTGLIDEVAFYQDTLLTLQEIQLHAATGGNGGTDNGHGSLFSYFDLNEGRGTELMDIGASLSGKGELKNGSFSIITRIQGATNHEFEPSRKLVNINPSATAIDNVNFTDLSTVPISGYVRFENTFCFQKKVEILVNGESFSPPVFTDTEGKFVVDLEPGADVVLTADFDDHEYFPGFWEFRKVARPISGVLFQNLVKREVRGQVAGGYCDKSIIPSGAIVKVKLETLNGCYSETIQLENPNGKFTFEGVPPDSVTVAVVEHSVPNIYDYFQLKGGEVLDLRMEEDTTTFRDTIGFSYFAPPEVEMSEISTNDCGTPMLNPAQSQTITVKVFEDYFGDKCYLDTALLTINNVIADMTQFDTLMTEGQFKHKFKAGLPNIVPPYEKLLQVTAEAHAEQNTQTASAVVLGKRPRATTFASASPEIPTLIVRDPPGDGSSAFVEEGTTTCQTWSVSASNSENENDKVNISLGAETTTSVGVGAETELKIKATNNTTMEATTTFTHLTTSTAETCLTFTETIATGDNDLIVGSEMGGDVYVGSAINFIYGITDELIWDTLNCSYFLDKGLYVYPDGFGTVFIYSERFIENNIIPGLETINDLESADRWRDIIERNNLLKEKAIFSENISFDAGVNYSLTETTTLTESETHEFTAEFSDAFATEFGLTVNDVGLTGGLSVNLTTSESKSATNSESKTRTVGYNLADDDFFDNYSVDIKKDPVYGTPVFDVVSGQSSCPHEPNTQPREEVSFSANKQVAVNIPENDAATFTLTLGNIAQSDDIGFYTLDLVPGSNPNNAEILIAGDVLNAPVTYSVLPGESIDVDFSVGRGTSTEYIFEDLKVAYYSTCQVEHANSLGIPRSGVDPKFYKELSFDVVFIEPCSSVDLAQTLEGWVLTPGDPEVLTITVNEYDLADDDLELIRVQYRRSQGDGAWINIGDDIMKADLGVNGFTLVEWNTNGLKDGNYEIRAITQCFGAQNPGISHIRKGTIERTPPELFGDPQPADGVLSAADEISIQFTEDIRCDLLIQADIFNNNNVGLYDATTNELIDALVTCNGDKITIVPNIQNRFIENRILRVEIDDIKDLAGNAFVHAEWEFFVDRNPLRWEKFDLQDNKYEDEEEIVIREITNAGGSVQAYEITGVPEWVEVLPMSGFLTPGETQPISFKFDNTLVLGEFRDTVYMEGAEGDEPLPIIYRNLCRTPEWEIEASDFTYSMNFTAEFNIQGEISEDNMDIVGAFIDGELRGKAYLEYEPFLEKYMAFLTVYSNEFLDDMVEFQIWDANECLLYGNVVESFPYAADEVIGSPNEPVELHTNGLVLRKIPLKSGWNWISFNLGLPYPELDSSLVSLSHPENDLIKSQTAFANYYNDPALNGWVGSLSDLNNTSMFQFRADVQDTISMVGLPIDIDMVDIPLNVGWNWIGYVPQSPMFVNEALASLAPLNGDIIKSQTAFAQYVAGFGWIGNLDFMQAPRGYLLRVAEPGTLTYPDNFKENVTEEKTVDEPLVFQSPWTVDPNAFEHSMILIGMISKDGENITQEGQSIGVFANGETRGIAQSMYVEQLDEWYFFLTIYANESGEPLNFQLYDALMDQTTELEETMNFSIDGQEGTVQLPVPFMTDEVSSLTETGMIDHPLWVQPNPFSQHLNIRFHTQTNGEAIVTMTDAMGRIVKQDELDTVHGWNGLDWYTADFAPGMYVVKVETEGMTMTRKVVAH